MVKFFFYYALNLAEVFAAMVKNKTSKNACCCLQVSIGAIFPPFLLSLVCPGHGRFLRREVFYVTTFSKMHRSVGTIHLYRTYLPTDMLQCVQTPFARDFYQWRERVHVL